MQRKTLRRDLLLRRIGGGYLGTTNIAGSINLPFVVMDPAAANPDLAGQNMWQGAFIRAGSSNYRVGSFNIGSGAFLSAQNVLGTAVPSGGDFEVSQKISPNDMDRYLDEVIALVRFRQEVGIPSIDGLTFYTLDGAASPNQIKSVLNAYWFQAPNGSLARWRHDFTQEQIVFTATGMELRLPGGLPGSAQIVLDAMLQVTLGAADLATVNFPDEETVLWGAASRVWDRLMVDSPGQEYGNYAKLNQRAVLQYNFLSKKNLPEIDHKIGFDSPYKFQRGGNWLGPLDDWW